MGIDLGLLKAQCSRTLERTDLQGIGQRTEYKVRDCYVRGETRVIVVTDRSIGKNGFFQCESRNGSVGGVQTPPHINPRRGDSL